MSDERTILETTAKASDHAVIKVLSSKNHDLSFAERTIIESAVHDLAKLAVDVETQLTAERDGLKAECERLREGLIKLRDCDFVITPSDRMDAVRKIARDTLNKENTDD